MARVISVFLPRWPTDRLRRKMASAAPPADKPLVVAARQGNRRILVGIDVAASALGLHAGMPVTQAQALVPDLHVEPADLEGDSDSLERLAFWLLQHVSPMVAVDGASGIVIDSTGADHLHGGETAMLDGLAGRLALSGVTARIAIADNLGAAHALARYRADPLFIALPSEGVSCLMPLPLEALRIDPAMAKSLRVLGFTTVGDLLRQPRAPLIRRFGPSFGRRLAEALGETAEPIDPIRPMDLIEARRNFPEPIGAAETIARYIGKLVTELCNLLAAQGLGARRLDLLCYRVDSRIETVRIGLATPIRDVARLTRLLCDKIETISPGFGIEAMALAATIVESLQARQLTSSLVADAAPDLSGLIDRLANRSDTKAIYRMTPVASEVPERSVCRIAPFAEPARLDEEPLYWPGHWPRPSRLLPQPELIETMALLPDHPPRWLTWRGARHIVRRADGPERIFGEWWKRDAELAAVRDYFRVEDEDGARYWIFRSGDGEDAATGSHRWYMHGVFG